jgi:hypothetical protein
MKRRRRTITKVAEEAEAEAEAEAEEAEAEEADFRVEDLVRAIVTSRLLKDSSHFTKSQIRKFSPNKSSSSCDPSTPKNIMSKKLTNTRKSYPKDSIAPDLTT